MDASYARISGEDQSKYSISDQLRQCRQKAQSEDIKEYVDEGYSGEFLDRPALQQLRKDVRDGLITRVICLDPDRLSRKLMNQLIVSEEIEKRAELVFVNGEYSRTPEGMLFYQMRGAVAEFEKAKINERMSRGRREKARQGKVVRDFQVYGYGYDKETASMYIIEEEAAVVRLIFDMVTALSPIVKGINGVAHYLTRNGVPTKRGAGQWHRQVVRQLLMNRAYLGEFSQNRWNTEGMLGNRFKSKEDRIPVTERPREEWIQVPCPAIIEPLQFEHAQRLLSESKRRWAKTGVNPYLLSGLLRCGLCGNTMTGRRTKNWGKHVFEYTDIKNTAGTKNRGCGLSVRRETLDAFVWDSIRDMMREPEQIATAKEQVTTQSFEKSEISRIEQQLENKKQARKRLLKLFSEGTKDIGEDEIRTMLKEIKDEEGALETQLVSLQEVASSTERNEHTKHQIKDAAQHYLSIGEDKLTFEDKQNIIRHIVKEIRVFNDTIEMIGL